MAFDNELWHVHTAYGVQTMTLDELDAAFQRGAIDENTKVLKSGAIRWTTLADAAGLGAEEETPPSPNSIAPFAVDVAAPVIPPMAPMPFPSPYHPSFGAGFVDEDEFQPKRRAGKVIMTMGIVAVAACALLTLESRGLNLGGKLSAVTSLVKGENAGAARSVAVAPPSAANELPPPSKPSAPPMVNAKPVEPAPVAIPAAAASDKNADKKTKKDKAEKKGKGRRGGGAAKGGDKAEPSHDPTQKGSGQFDPLNGNL